MPIIFQYAEDRRGDIADIYRRIFKSDCRALLGRSTPFWRGMAKALFFYANLYAREGFVVSVELLSDLAVYFGECDVPERYSTSNVELVKDTILKKYFGLDIITTKNSGVRNLFRFHHDTMADNGWMSLEGLVDERYDDATLQGVLNFFAEKYPRIVGVIYCRQLRLPGNKGTQAARAYLNMRHPETHPMAFPACLKKLRNETVAKDKEREFLNTEKKKLWEIKEAFAVSLNLLKAEELAKVKAREFLNTEKPWTTTDAFAVCLDLLKNEKAGIDRTVFILENRREFNADHHWSL